MYGSELNVSLCSKLIIISLLDIFPCLEEYGECYPAILYYNKPLSCP